MRKIAPSLLLAVAGCNLAPQFERPPSLVSSAFPLEDATGQDNEAALAGNMSWSEYVIDGEMRNLIGLALEHNRDLQQSVARLEQARAKFRLQDSQRLPAVDLSGAGSRSRQPPAAVAGASGGSAEDAIKVSQFSTGLGVSTFELDFWGRLRNLAAAERSRYLGTVEANRAFRLSLIAQVSAAVIDIAAQKRKIAVAEMALEGRRDGVSIARKRLDAGVTSLSDYDQSVLLLTQAQTELSEARRLLARSENLLEVLVGGSAREAGVSVAALSDRPYTAPLKAGLPSALLRNRPDILEAEYNLRGANADIGAARAAFFPSISLTGSYGYASSTLQNLVNSANTSWNFGANLALPIFDWGRRRADLDTSKARQKELVAAYQLSVQKAFQEVADGLAGVRYYGEQVEAQTRTVEAQRRLSRIARLRYESGVAIYLEVLDAERNLFNSEQQLVQLKSLEIQNQVNLYVALGGDAKPA